MDGVETETQVVGNLLRLTSFKGVFLFYTENLFSLARLKTYLLLQKD